VSLILHSHMNKMNMSFIQKHTNFIAFIFLFSCFLVLLYRDAVLSKKLTIETDFSMPTPYFTTLRPATYARGNELVHSDAYVKVSLPRNFDKGTVRWIYEDMAGYDVWSGTGLEAAVITKSQQKLGENEYQVEFEDSNIPTERSYFIHVADLDRERPIVLKKLTLELRNDSINIGDYLNLWLLRIRQLL